MGIKTETLLIKSRIAEKHETIKRLAISADNHIITVRNKVDSNAFDKEEDFTELDLDSAKAAFDDLYEKWTQAKELKGHIAKLERDLNG